MYAKKMYRRGRVFCVIALLAGMGIFLTACGGDDSGNNADASTVNCANNAQCMPDQVSMTPAQ